MSAILDLDDGLREQLAAALLGWGGGGSGGDGLNRLSKDTIDSTSDEGGRATPKAEPGLGHHQRHVRGLIQYADEEGTTVDDNIDADSVLLDASDASGLDGWSENSAHAHCQQARRTTETPNPAATAAQKVLPPLPTEAPLASPPPEMSCRISRFPFSHPCDMPELMPDQEDMFGAVSSPSASAPVTPCIAPDVFRPLTQLLSPDLDLGLYHNPAHEPDLHDRARKMSTADTVGSEELGIIQEEDDANTDGVSVLTPTEASCGNSVFGFEGGLGGGDKQGLFPTAGHSHGRGHGLSVSSVGSGSSGEWRPSHTNAAARRSVNFFSRMRNVRNEEACLEKRSLTPMHLSTPPSRGQGAADDELPTPDGTTPTSPSSYPNRGETSATSRFFNRMPWLGDSQSRKPEAVFGVDLKESIRVAPMKIRISHKGRSTSYRTFPLAVHKCCEFIRRAGMQALSPAGVTFPLTSLGGTDGNIFSLAGNAYNVASLKAIFSLPPSFGEQFQFEGSDYTVHDAAQLILTFLEELPKPLISPSVVRSWILLARQEGAIEPPCPRVETGLDFWTEALNRLPTTNRNLTKHLLTLFAEVLLAAAGTITEADARQLAAAVSKAMFHHDADGSPATSKGRDQRKKPARRNVQPTLALAFLIKKRGDYAVALSAASKEAASKRDSKMFLPSTQEMLEWKGMVR